jgi:hypothetical protein
MSWKILLDAFALMLVFEGLWPFVNPKKYRHFLLIMLTQSERNLRVIGLALMLVGLIIAVTVHNL